ncbi:hypothetical protein [Sphingomonas sp. IC081]|uniref:hypothetical protein n=1 Tax=Sphingomonas sp. IC081 TaxID=304378 RepID=UPI001157389A|nr:hypothetical protein [Sphingomonas sp. IC081]
MNRLEIRRSLRTDSLSVDAALLSADRRAVLRGIDGAVGQLKARFENAHEGYSRGGAGLFPHYSYFPNFRTDSERPAGEHAGVRA